MKSKESLSICLVSQEYPEETGWGGIGTYTYELAHGLARLGHHVIVLSRAVEKEQQYVEADGVEVYRVLPAMSLHATPILWRLNRWWEGYRLAVAKKLGQLLREQQIDVIESPELHAEPLLFSLVNRRPPLVIRLHTGSRIVSSFEPNVSPQPNLNQRIESWLIRRAAFVTCPSDALRASLNGELGSRPLKVIPNPVDVERFTPTGETTTGDSGPNILCVARPRLIKGIHVLAKAMPGVWQQIPEAKFTFLPAPMGKNGGSPIDAYREILGSLADDSRVRILDPVGRGELPSAYRGATLCVVPSLWEGFGYVAAEAMSCGVPVVASRAGGLAEIVEDRQSGILVEPGNADALACAITELINSHELRAKLAKAARQRALAKFAAPMIAVQMTEVYRNLKQSRAINADR